MLKTKIIICEYCGKQFKKTTKRITRTEKLGQKHTCSRKCSSSLVNENRRCEPVTSNAIKSRKDKEKYPERDHARMLVKAAVKTGKLIPLQECEICYSNNNIEAHHPNHVRPFLLLYLCKECHTYADTQPDKLIDLATDYSTSVGYNTDGGNDHENI